MIISSSSTDSRHFPSQVMVAAQMGKRYGSCTSELNRCAASMAGCVPLSHSLFNGPWRLPILLRLPDDAMPIVSSRHLHSTTGLAVNHFVRGKSALHSWGLSFRLQCVSGTRSPFSFGMWMWC